MLVLQDTLFSSFAEGAVVFIPRGLREPASEIVTLEMMKRTRALLIVRCTEEGLLSGQCMAIDAGLIEADANIQNSMPKED